MFLNGEEIATLGPRGERVTDDSFLLLFNASHEDCSFTLPNRRFGKTWTWNSTPPLPNVRRMPCTAGAREDPRVALVVLLRRASDLTSSAPRIA